MFFLPYIRHEISHGCTCVPLTSEVFKRLDCNIHEPQNKFRWLHFPPPILTNKTPFLRFFFLSYYSLIK